MAIKEIRIEPIRNGYVVTIEQTWPHSYPERSVWAYGGFAELVCELAGWLLKTTAGEKSVSELFKDWGEEPDD